MLSLKDKINWYEKNSNKIHKTAVIYWDYVSIGANNIIGENTVIGSPGEISKNKNYHFQGKVIIGHNNIINSYVNIDRPFSRRQKTYIGHDNYISKKTYIGHDCEIGNNCTFRMGTIIGGETIIENYVNTGMGAKITNSIRIGESAYIGAGSVCMKSMPPFYISYGIPCKPIKYNIIQMKERKLSYIQMKKIITEWKLRWSLVVTEE